METNADSQAARAGGRQVRLTNYGFVPASQLWQDDRDVDGAAGEETEENSQ